MPKISVVIPAYNCAAFLPAAIESVLAQTYTGAEIIVVDDGSTDGTGVVLAAYRDRVTVLVQENRGLPAARNAGVRAANGEFIALLDADDSWLPEKLEAQMPHFSDLQVGIVYTDFAVQYADGRFQESYLVNRPLAGDGYVLEAYIQSRFLFPSTMVLRRECLEGTGLFDEEMLACEDIELFARICARWKVALVRRPLMIRNEGDHNITANGEKMSFYTILALQKILLKEPGLSASARKTIQTELGKQYWWRGYAAFERGEMGKCRENLWMAMRMDLRLSRRGVPLIALSLAPASVIGRMRGLKTAGAATGRG